MDPYVGEIRPVAFTFAPQGWALCQGQLLSINQFSALYSLLGTSYGGDGRSTFGLPNLQGMIAVGSGAGSGLSTYSLGEQAGTANVTLTVSTMPSHGHTLPVNPTTLTAGSGTPGPTVVLGGAPEPRKASTSYYVSPSVQAGAVAVMANVVGPTGGSQPHNNMAPYVAIQYIISLQGIYPPRP